MLGVDTGVENSYHALAVGCQRGFPQFVEADCRDAPLHAVHRFFHECRGIGNVEGADNIVGFGKFHLVERLQFFDELFHACCLCLVEFQAVEFAHVVGGGRAGRVGGEA